MSSIAVLGIGNNLLTDDGAGIHTLEQFAADNPHEDVTCIDAGTVGLALMDRLCGLDGLVAVDAMRLRAPAGTVTVLEGVAMDALRLSDELPAKRALIGIEPAELGWGTEPTPEVAAAIPEAVTRLLALLQAWKTTPEPAS